MKKYFLAIVYTLYLVLPLALLAQQTSKDPDFHVNYERSNTNPDYGRSGFNPSYGNNYQNFPYQRYNYPYQGYYPYRSYNYPNQRNNNSTQLPSQNNTNTYQNNVYPQNKAFTQPPSKTFRPNG